MTYPCERCNMDEGSPICLGDGRCPNVAKVASTISPVRINGQLYMRPSIRVAVIRLDGTSCTVPVGDLLDVIGDGGEYSVHIKTMPLREFERMPEFSGW